ncbi:hypothetical protein LTR17_015917 [Elasticomyces elasticus]|nr:hypothetical protein LTR17_015917 [Elasticomyces elasticus]
MARTKQTARKNKQPKDSSSANPLKRKADTIEEAETRQDVLDSRTNAVGRKRNKTDGNEFSRPLIIDDIPKGLRKLVKLEMDRGPGSLIDALARCSEPYKANCKQLKKLHAQYTSGVSGQPAEEVETASEYSEGDMVIDSDSDSVDLASLDNSGKAESGDRSRRGSHHEHNLRERRFAGKPARKSSSVNSDWSKPGEFPELRNMRPLSDPDPEPSTKTTAKKKPTSRDPNLPDMPLAQVQPKALRLAVSVMASKDGLSHLEAVKRHRDPGMPNRKAAKSLYDSWVAIAKKKYSLAPDDESDGDEDDVSVGEVPPPNGAIAPAQGMTGKEKPVGKDKKLARSRDITLADLGPYQLRAGVENEVKAKGCSVLEALYNYAEDGGPSWKKAMRLHKKWSAGKAYRELYIECKPEQAVNEQHADRDNEMSVGEVSPNMETSDDHQAMPQHSSPDEGQVSSEDLPRVADVVRVGDLDEQDQRLQAKYFMLTDPDAYCLCLSCGNTGHDESTCPANACAHCGSIGAHFAAACPTYRKCGKCRQRGHDAAHCTRRAVQGGGAEDPCDVCAHTGHVEEECTDLSRTIGEVDAQRQVTRVAARSMRKACYNCGSNKHWGDNCDTLPSYILKKTGDRGTWSAQHAGKYILDDQDIEEQPAYGRPAPAAYYPQSYQLAALDY